MNTKRIGARNCSQVRSLALYYALDIHSKTLCQLRYSVASVRSKAPNLRIYAVIAGEVPRVDLAFLNAFGVTVIPSKIDAGVSPTYMKWRALAELPAECDLIYLDTDTLAFDDPSRLFNHAGDQDFAARFELGCDPQQQYPYLLNTNLMRASIVDEWLVAKIAERLGIRPGPIFNTGVMLFRNGAAQRIARYWQHFLELDRRFRYKRIPYPCNIAHVLEEIVASFVLATVQPLSWAPLPSRLCPSFLEYRGRNIETPGIVLHAWSAFYESCIFEFIGKEEATAYLDMPHERWRFRTRALANARAGFLLLGSTFGRLPRPMLNAWLRLSPRYLYFPSSAPSLTSN